MAFTNRTKISEYDATAANNINLGTAASPAARLGEYGVDADAEAMRPSDTNGALRELMAHLKAMDAGTQPLTSPDFTAFSIGAVDVTATAAELNQLDGTTITAFAKTFLDDATADDVRATIDAEKNRLPIKAGEAIVKGAPVYATGTVGASGKITVSNFIADSSLEEIYLIGVADRDLATNDEGFAISFGELANMQTDGQDSTLSANETWANGDVLYASAATAGFLTKTAPTSPDQAIPVAIVVYSHSSSGILFVRPTIGSHIGELHDVQLSGSEADGSILVYDGDKFVDESGDTARASLGLAIGSDVQAHSTNLDTYALNPLAEAELQQLQNIDTTQISAAQWTHVGALDQDLATTSDVTFNNIDNTVIGGTTPAAISGTTGTFSGGIYLGGTGAANYLDDYEEGTWTPAIFTDWTVNPTFTSTTYTKIGRQVTLFIDFATGTTGAPYPVFGGVPFSGSGVGLGSNSNIVDMGHAFVAGTTVYFTLDNTNFAGARFTVTYII